MNRDDDMNDPGPRQRILAAAASLMASEGIKGATTRAIARAAGVNEVTIFRLFATKEGLLAAVLENLFPDRSEAAPLAVLLQRPTSTRAELAALLAEFGDQLHDNFLVRNHDLINILIRGGPELASREDILFQRVAGLVDLVARRCHPDPTRFHGLAGVWLNALISNHFVRSGAGAVLVDPHELNRLMAGIIAERVYPGS